MIAQIKHVLAIKASGWVGVIQVLHLSENYYVQRQCVWEVWAEGSNTNRGKWNSDVHLNKSN